MVSSLCELSLVLDGPGFGEGGRGLPAESAVSSIAVVVDPPLFGQDPRFEQAVEELAVQVLVAEPTWG